MAQSSEIKLLKRFDQNVEITGTLTVGGSSVITSIPSEYLTQTEGDARYLQSFTVPSEYLTQTEGDARYIQSSTSSIYIYDNNTSTGSYPELRFNTANNQGVKFVHNEFDNELPVGGYGLVLTGDVNNTQFGTTGTLSFIVHGEIYSGGITNSAVNRVWHQGDFTSTNVTNWDTAYGWGNHAGAGYANAADINESIAQSLGWVPAYSNTDTSSIRWNETEQAVEIQSSSDTTTGAAYKAIRMKAGDMVRLTVMVRATVATTDGLYLRLYFHNGDMPDGKTHVSNSASSSTAWVQEDDSGDTGWWENNAVTTSWENFERTYTAPADGYLSLVILNWSGLGTGPLYVKNPDIQFEKVNQATSADSATNATNATNAINATNADTVDLLHASQFLRSDTADTSSGRLSFRYDVSDFNSVNGAIGVTPFNGSFQATNRPGSGNYATGLEFAYYDSQARTQLAAASTGSNNTGELWIRSEQWGSTPTWTDWWKIWHSGNDGSGSGLDADDLDGFTWMDSGKSVRGNYVYVGSGGGFFYNDSGSRVRIDHDFYTNNSNTYLYATNLYLGASSGDNVQVRGNRIFGNNWEIDASGNAEFQGTLAVGHTAPSGGDYTTVVPELHVRGADTSGTYTTVARFQAGNDADNTGAAVLINHANDRGLAIRAGRKDSDRPVAYFDLIDSNGSATNVFTIGEYGSDFRAGINTTSPDTTFHVNGGAKIGGSFQGTELLIEASDTAGAPASTATIKMIGYEGRGIGTFYKDVTYGSPEWFAGIRYSGSFQNYQIGYTATGGQAEYSTNAIMTITNGGRVGIGTSAPTSQLQVTGDVRSDYAFWAVGTDGAGNVQPSANNARFSGYGIIGNRGTFYVTNGGGDVQIGNGTIHNENPAASFSPSGIGLYRSTSVTGSLTSSGSIKAQSTSYIDVSADQTDSAMIKIGVSSGSIEGFVMTDNTSASHIDGNAVIKMLVYSTGGALIEPARFTTDGIVANGSDPAQNAEITSYGNMSFGHPGSGGNTNGRFISIEGNADASGEGSGRLFFAEHNSTTTSMDAYGMSIGYRGGGTTITGASGNSWTGLSQIENGQWGMWGHDNDATGALIMYGDRAATFVNFAGNDIREANYVYGNRFVDQGDNSYYCDPASTSVLNYINIHRLYGIDGNIETYDHIEMQDNYNLRLGAGADFRMWHDGTSTIFRNYNHAAGNMYWQGEDAEGTNTALIYMICDTSRTYVSLYENGEERLRTTSSGVTVYGTMTATADVVAYSDIRTKENIKPITSALDKVKKIQGVEFNKIGDTNKSIGVIAQEIEKVLPEVVREQNDGMKAVAYGNITAILIEAVKELSNKVEELENKLNGTK